MFRMMRRNLFRSITRNNKSKKEEQQPSIPTVLSLVEEEGVEVKQKEGGTAYYNLDNDTFETMDGEDSSTVRALTDEQVDDCKEAFCVFVDLEG